MWHCTLAIQTSHSSLHDAAAILRVHFERPILACAVHRKTRVVTCPTRHHQEKARLSWTGVSHRHCNRAILSIWWFVALICVSTLVRSDRKHVRASMMAWWRLHHRLLKDFDKIIDRQLWQSRPDRHCCRHKTKPLHYMSFQLTNDSTWSSHCCRGPISILALRPFQLRKTSLDQTKQSRWAH